MLNVSANLQFSIIAATSGGTAAEPINGTVTGRGARLRIVVDDLGGTDRTSARQLLRELGRILASQRLQATIHNADGLLATVGDVRPSLLGRCLIRSRYVRPGSPATLLKALRSSRRRFPLASLVPPPMPWPVAPTFQRLPRRVTTTHDPKSGGRPRLFFAGSDNPLPGEETYVFHLRVGSVTTIGSGPDCDLVLDGLESRQAEIRRDEDDEYVVVATGTMPCRVHGRTVGTVNGRPGYSQPLRTGSRIDLGPWSMIYFRLEYADHGRPYGGRIGGEAGHQRPQGVPTYRRP